MIFRSSQSVFNYKESKTLLPTKGKLFFSWQGVGQQTSPRHPVYCGTDLLLGP